MAISYGFFNSINHDRLYDAVDISRLFNGLVTDGVYETIGGGMRVYEGDTPDRLTLASGRAWFNSTWIENVGDLTLVNDISGITSGNYRVDAVLIYINHITRLAAVRVEHGEVGGSPVRPTFIDTDTEFYHVLAWVEYYNDGGNTTIRSIDFGNFSYVSGILTNDPGANSFIQSLSDQWDAFIAEKQQSYGHIDQLLQNFMNEEANRTTTTLADIQTEFTTWFNYMKAHINNDAAAIQEQISDIEDGYVPKSMISQENVDNANKIPSSKVLYDLAEHYVPTTIVTFHDATDAEFVEALRMAYNDEIDLQEDLGWEVGDTRQITLEPFDFTYRYNGQEFVQHGDAQTIELVILDTDAFDLADGHNKCKFVIGFKDFFNVLSNKISDDQEPQNNYPWNDGLNVVYRYLNESLFRLPSYLIGVAKEFKAPYARDINASTVEYYNIKLGIPSAIEFFGTNVPGSTGGISYSSAVEIYEHIHGSGHYPDLSGYFKQFDYYKSAANRIYPTISGHYASNAFLRSTAYSYSNRSSFWASSFGVNNDPTYINTQGSILNYVLPLFVI